MAEATDCVKKSLDKLDDPIREALAVPANVAEAPVIGEIPGNQASRTLDGGTLVYYRDRIELASVTVCTPHNGVIWRILLLLREHRNDGRPRAFPGKAIVDRLGLDRGQNAVCDAVSPFRRKLCQLPESEGFTATEDTLIVTGKSGYQTRADLPVKHRTDREPAA